MKRRNPNKYIKNPSKVYFTTLGKSDYAFTDSPKANKITSFNNTMQIKRQDYKSNVPESPKMDFERAPSLKKRVIITEASPKPQNADVL